MTEEPEVKRETGAPVGVEPAGAAGITRAIDSLGGRDALQTAAAKAEELTTRNQLIAESHALNSQVPVGDRPVDSDALKRVTQHLENLRTDQNAPAEQVQAAAPAASGTNPTV